MPLLLGALLLLVSCTQPSGSTTAANDGAVSPDVVLQLDSLLAPRGFTIADDGLIYGLDHQQHRVWVYNAEGDLVDSFGSEGRGPGEFMSPMRIAVSDTMVYVTERSARVHMYRRDGQHVETIMATGVLHMSSSFHTVGDSVFVVNGYRDESLIDGTLVHVMNREGEVNSYGPVNENSKAQGVSVLFGNMCDLDREALQLYCVQPTDYTIRAYDLEGNTLPEVAVQSEVHEALSQPQPEVEKLRGAEGASWMGSWHVPLGVFLLGNSKAIVYVGQGTTARLDLVDIASGETVAYRVMDQRPWYLDKRESMLYFKLPATEALFAEFEGYRVASLFPQLAQGR
ncbi:MAG: BF3164 family lipoprotein [Bacteroidota bacterium]